jgi:prophage maintenance system killer protein
MSKKEVSKYPFRRKGKKEHLVIPISQNDGEKYGLVIDEIWYPSAAFIEDTHQLLLERYGGYVGYERGIGVYDVILKETKDTMGIYRKAAILLYDLCYYRIYKDGNHRTAIVTARTFLIKNGEKLSISDPEKIYKFVKGIALYSVEIVEAWIRHGYIKERSN